MKFHFMFTAGFTGNKFVINIRHPVHRVVVSDYGRFKTTIRRLFILIFGDDLIHGCGKLFPVAHFTFVAIDGTFDGLQVAFDLVL